MGLLADSCGTIDRSGAFVVQPLTEQFIDWATVIVCMESTHVARVMEFPLAKSRKIYCWDLPDDYPRAYDETLVNICTRKMEATLRAYMSGRELAAIMEKVRKEENAGRHTD